MSTMLLAPDAAADLVVSETPWEEHAIGGAPVLVKREDLCCGGEGPPFSKMRGIAAHLRERRERIIGVLDTLHSMGGWGVSYICRALGKQAVVFYPVYARESDGDLRDNQRRCRDLGARLVPLRAGRSAILYHRARRILSLSPNTYMMPNALKTAAAVEANAREVATAPRRVLRDAVWVVSVSSGTIASGVLRGLIESGAERVTLVLHLGYSRSEAAVLRYVLDSAAVPVEDRVTLRVVDEGYAYADAVESAAPFPSNEHYDAKAWRWLAAHRGDLAERVVFWNIGA